MPIHPAVALAFAALLAASPSAAQAPAASDTLARIRSAKQIDVAYSPDSPPFSFNGDGDRPAGYAIELCNRVIAQIGRAVGMPDLKTIWVAGNVAQRIEMVRSGKVQLECANTSATLARMQGVDFSVLVFVDGAGVLVRTDGAVRRFAELGGRTVGVQGATTTEPRLRELLREQRIDAKVTLVRDGAEGIGQLQSGAIDALAGDRLELVGLAARTKEPDAFTMLPGDLSIELNAFALPRNDAAFRLEVNRALAQVYASGEIDAIFDRWLGPYGRPSGLVAALYILNAIPR